MSDWQKAADRLHDASKKYREAVDTEQATFRELIQASDALDKIESAGTLASVSSPSERGNG